MKSPHKRIPVSEPNLCGKEIEYVVDSIESTWISSRGEYIDRFEESFSKFIATKHSISVSNGTVALHLILEGLGIGHGDEVIVPTLTYVASANAVTYSGATPIFVDCDPLTWNIDVSKIENSITESTRAIMVVHLYGSVTNIAEIKSLCNKYNLFLIEDAAEALGSKYEDAMAGSLGDAAAFSFFANKTITTGEGGMVSTDNEDLAEKIRLLKNQGQSPDKRYFHEIIGYNYRMTNVQAAIGLAQMENIEHFIEKKRMIASIYKELLSPLDIQSPYELPGTINSHWMYSILVNQKMSGKRDKFMNMLQELGVETRPFFYPMHTLPMYASSPSKYLRVSEAISKRGLNLPSSTKLDSSDLEYICEKIIDVYRDLEKEN